MHEPRSSEDVGDDGGLVVDRLQNVRTPTGSASSHFAVDGSVLNGSAITPLAEVETASQKRLAKRAGSRR